MRILLIAIVGLLVGSGMTSPPRPDLFEEDVLPPELEQDACVNRGSCFLEGVLNWGNTTELNDKNIVMRNCFCDPLCWTYADCCADVVEAVNTGQQPWDKNIPSQLEKETFECVSGTTKRLDVPGDLLLVNRCPAGWKDDVVRESCEHPPPSDLFLNIPVTDVEGVLYQNKVCALCHEAGETVFWQMQVKCNMEVSNVTSEELQRILTEKLHSGFCFTQFLPPPLPIAFRPCKKLVSTCPETWSDSVLCEEGVHSYVYESMSVGKRSYMNHACAMCHNVSDTTCADFQYHILKSGLPPFYPLSFILDINTKSGDATGYGISGRTPHDDFNQTLGHAQSCEDNHVYDVFNQKCRPLWCPLGFQLQDEKCVPDGSNSTQLACPMIKLNSSEFTILDRSNNARIYVNNTEEILPSEAYFLQDDGSVLICTNFSKEYFNESVPLKFSTAQTILSVIGQVISIICLSVHITVYCMFRKLRNLAGMNIMSLSVCLLIAQFLFLFAGSAIGSYALCCIVGVLVHYFFLAAFLWMNVMAFDICKTFVKFSKPSSGDQFTHKFLRYCAYCFLTAFAIVLCAVVVNFTLDESLYRPGYGEGLCWIRYRKALIVFFAVPVALLVSSNLVYFAVTLHSIQKAMKLSKMATDNKRSDRDRFWLYVKLSSIMGLTWVFGFVAAIFDVQALWYLFIIFNSLQGAMIGVAFVLTKQVLGLLKGKFSKVPFSESEMATRSTGLSSNSSSDPASSHLLRKH